MLNCKDSRMLLCCKYCCILFVYIQKHQRNMVFRQAQAKGVASLANFKSHQDELRSILDKPSSMFLTAKTWSKSIELAEL